MGNTSKRRYHDSSFFNSNCDLTLFDDFGDKERTDEADAVWRETRLAFGEAGHLLSTCVEGSDIWRFNRACQGESVEVSWLTAALVNRSTFIWKATEGTFDPSAYPLIDLWGFSPRVFNGEKGTAMPYDRPTHARSAQDRPSDGHLDDGSFYLPPDRKYIDAFSKLVGMDGVEIGGDDVSGYSLVKRTTPVIVSGVTYQGGIDLGGIAKGYLVDEAIAPMRRHGFRRGVFSTSSSIAVLADDGVPFNVNIVDPCPLPGTAPLCMRIKVAGRCLSTSGDYGRGRMVGSLRLSHEIDPRTGYPAGVTPELIDEALADTYEEIAQPLSEIRSLTLVGPSGIDCDALTTALSVLGPRDAIEFFNENLRRTHDLVMILNGVTSEESVIITSFAPEDYRLLNTRYKVISRMSENGLEF